MKINKGQLVFGIVLMITMMFARYYNEHVVFERRKAIMIEKLREYSRSIPDWGSQLVIEEEK